MHPAKAFRVEDEAALLAHLERHPFMTLTAAPAGQLLVAQAPMIVRRRAGQLMLDFHLSNGNALTPFLVEGFAAVTISHGPNAYVSPDWYGLEDQVPTWNYMSVEAHGWVAPMDNAGLVALLDDLSAQEEGRLAPKPPWTRHKMSDGRFEAMTRMILGGSLIVERLEGTFKLGQNKSAEAREGVIAALGDHPIAQLMADL
jgi:transcriptional regulator